MNHADSEWMFIKACESALNVGGPKFHDSASPVQISGLWRKHVHVGQEDSPPGSAKAKPKERSPFPFGIAVNKQAEKLLFIVRPYPPQNFAPVSLEENLFHYWRAR